MLSFFTNSQPYKRPGGQMGSMLLGVGLLCVFFGLAIISAPELLAYFVATFLIVIGVSFLMAWWRMRQ